MKRNLVLISLLIVFLSSLGHLEARGFGRIGARGFGHFSRGRASALGFGIHGQRHFGHSFLPQRFRSSGFGFGYYYTPFYTYGYYSMPGYESLLLLPIYAGDYDFQPSTENFAKVNPKTNCKDTWASARHDDALASAIRSAFQNQCENEHQPGESNLPQTNGRD